MNYHEHWTRRALQGLVLLVVIAFGARVVYGLLVPLVPGAIVLVVLGILYTLIFGRRY